MTIRSLTLADLAFAQEVRGIAGWNQTDADWVRLLGAAPRGCFLVECEGEPAGTATTTAYGTDLGWIGMVLVHPDYRRRGLATALLERCIYHLREEEGVRCVKLDATPEGQKVYEKLGFQAEYELARWEGTEVSVLDEPVQIGGPVDWGSVRALDAQVFGADRIDYLRQLAADSSGVLAGGDAYGLLRPGSRAAYLGPVVAETPLAGRVLVRGLLGACAQSPVYWDIPNDNLEAVTLAEELGFQRGRRLIRMWLGQGNLPSDPAKQWAIGAPETG